jgi:hypothetical protein
MHLAEGLVGVGDVAQGEGADDGVEGLVGEPEVVGVAFLEVDLTVVVRSALTGDLQHLGAEVDAGDVGVGGVGGQVQPGADGDFQHVAVGSLARPGPVVLPESRRFHQPI